jgi:hypothetical protein
MGILQRLFPAKTTITSATIRAEIGYSESEITKLNSEIGPKLAAIATMADSEHVKVEADIAAAKRAIARLDSRIGLLSEQLPTVLAAEEAATKAEADAALIKRAEAARKANTKDAAKLLAAYNEHASAIGDILDELDSLDIEREAINAELRTNPVTEMVVSYTEVHRTTPATQATEQRSKVHHWIFRDAPPQRDEVHPGETEEALRATLDSAGNPIRPGGLRYGRFGQIITPQLEMRDVVTRTQFRPGRYEDSLGSVRLPPAFIGPYIWPRS